MGFGRAVGTGLAAATVAGCALLVVGMAGADADRRAPQAERAPRAPARTSPIPAQLPVSRRPGAHPAATARTAAPTPTPAATSARPSPTLTPSSVGPEPHPAPAPAHARTSPPASAPAPTSSVAAAPAAPEKTAPKKTAPKKTAPAKPAPAKAGPEAPAPKPGAALPLHFATGSASRVITVVARSAGSTTATLQAWAKMPGGGWRKAGAAVFAHVGAQGLTRRPSESKSATPIGSFTLTHAFGRYADPGTSLPYLHTTPADWWISQPGPLYNTHQRCSGRCPFTQGAPNEHLFYTVPFYRYAVVIDYNTRNAGPVRQGAGSAFFLHVTDGNPTAGCVAIPQRRLVPLMRWLTRGSHPRILIGVH
jgi:L,D-peptidoglycan transpeptidase YkuD (ErfK/YbiS/YcfS/YnhG family)